MAEKIFAKPNPINTVASFVGEKILYPTTAEIRKRWPEPSDDRREVVLLPAELTADIWLAWEGASRGWTLGEQLGHLAVEGGAPLVVGAAIQGITAAVCGFAPLVVKSGATHFLLNKVFAPRGPSIDITTQQK